MVAPLRIAPATEDVVGEVEWSAAAPHLGSEACCLAALMQIPADQARPIVDVLGRDDFTDPVYAALYGLIHGLIRRGQPHDYVMVAHDIDSKPAGIEHHLVPLRQQLVRLIGSAPFPERAPYYAKAVIAQSYRRSFETAAHALSEAVETVATDDLYEYMCQLGRRQRDHHTRYAAICATID